MNQSGARNWPPAGPRAWFAAVASVLIASTSACGLQFGQSGLACQQPPDPGEILGEREVPDIVGMTPDAAAAALERSDITPTWRYHYPTEVGGPGGYSECWCIPPPDGVVDSASADPGGQLIVMVRRQPIVGGRQQPELGWGCEESS